MTQYLPRYKYCFVCGGENRTGLNLRPFLEDNQVKIEFTASGSHVGFKDVVHGGILAALMDEASYWVATLATRKVCVTSEMQIRYEKPLPVRVPAVASALLLEKRGQRRLIVDARVQGQEGTEYAQATGTFVTVPGDLANVFSDDPSIGCTDFSAYSIEAARASIDP